MKNKESSLKSSTFSKRKNSIRLDAKEATRLITSGRKKSVETVQRNHNGPTKTQLERLKKFYNTTKWLPNSAFTTYFGKPAFENYGYGNTKPVYGGLFYGNYMLSHNINPMDGDNIPDSKQVYSSAMLKALRRNEIRKPEPPRKVPDEIRNTPDELEEIRGRNPIFQLPNQYPAREIIRPNLLKARYFRSGKNTPRDLSEGKDENDLNIEDYYEDFQIEDALNNKTTKRKKKTNYNTKVSGNFNPFNQGKVQLKKSKTKTDDNFSNNHTNYRNYNESNKKENMKNESDSYEEFLKQKNFYEKMLRDDEDHKLNSNNEMPTSKEFKKQYTKKATREDLKTDTKEEKEIQTGEDFNKTGNEEVKDSCYLCGNTSNRPDSRAYLRKKENPSLVEPQDMKHPLICCVHHSKETLSIDLMDPRKYKHMPSCTMKQIIPAGKPVKKSEPLGDLFK